jgi:hypothetical protein
VNPATTLSEIDVSEPWLHGIIGHYIDQQEREGSSAGAVVRERMEEGGVAQSSCLTAAREAIVFSQLAATVLDDLVFAAMLDEVQSVSDPALVEMRQHLFEQGFEVVIESLAGTDAIARGARRLDLVRARFVAA